MGGRDLCGGSGRSGSCDRSGQHEGEIIAHRCVARISYDEEIDSFFGEVINTSDLITFYGRSVEDLKREMATSIEVHLEACRAKGVEPSRPYSGKFNVRLSPAEHARIAGAAAVAGKSMNAWIAEALAEAAERTLTE